MASWEQARNELNQEQAQAKAYRERFEKLAEDAAYRLVRVLDPKIRQFVQTLHDHNQWPTVSKQIKVKKREKKGLLGIRFEEKIVSKTVTEPTGTMTFECTATTRSRYPSDQDYRLTISSNQAWTLSRFWGWMDDRRWDEHNYPVLEQTAKGTQVKSSTELVRPRPNDPRVIEPEFNLDELNNTFIKKMANYLIERGLPLPRD